MWIILLDVDNSSCESLEDEPIDTFSVKSYTMNQECYSCHRDLTPSDIVQCCFPCQQMFRIPCIENKAHAYHYDQLYRAKTISQLVSIPGSLHDTGQT